MTKHNKFDVLLYQVLVVVMVLASSQISASATSSKLLKLQVGGVTFELVRVPAGQFQMGSGTGDSDAKPVHGVRINEGFYMGKTEVTVRQFRAFAQATGYKTEAEKGNWAASYSPAGFPIVPGRGLNWREPGFPQSEDNPTVCISWNDSAAFCKWLSKETGEHYRLPSEAEWEYA
ncbi:MAG: formylglycine-generating enzyme family protein [Planctomycetota bacterium]|jgi:formylglycine-generating enzyme required for sulfatase activity